MLNYLWRAHGAAAAAIRLTLDLAPVPLSVNAAVPCGLILNELASNALKHAFRGRTGGVVTVTLARAAAGPADLEASNPNDVGGDINGGIEDLRQLFTRPVARLDPYSTPARGIYLCSASTPPGGGVHGMSGYFAARSALRREFGIRI